MIQWNSGAVGAYAKLPFHRRQNKRQAEFQAPRSAKPCNLSWNHHNDLGVPVQLVQGNRYQSRWLVESAGAPCGSILTQVQQVVSQQQNQPPSVWPWENMGVYLPTSQLPAGWPADMGALPFQTPNMCLLLLDGVWRAPTTPTMDTSQLPKLPGFFPFDTFNVTTGQKLVQGPMVPGPCSPADLTFDAATSIFRCAGQIITTQTPNQCPAGQVRLADGTCGPASGGGGGGSGTKTEEKSSVLPWVIGGGVVLLGGAYLLTR